MLEINAQEFIGNQIYLRALHELPVCEVLWRLAAKGERVIDVGANIGVMTSLLSLRVGPEGCVYSFEPHPELFDRLCRNVRQWSRSQVQALEWAASDRTGNARLSENDAFAQNAGTADLICRSVRNRTFEVRTVRLDDALPACHYKVLKIDVEGHEGHVLDGAVRAIRDGRFHNVVLESREAYPSRAHLVLLNHGFNLFAIGSSFSGPKLLEPDESAAPESSDYLATLDAGQAKRIFAPRGWQVLCDSISARLARV